MKGHTESVCRCARSRNVVIKVNVHKDREKVWSRRRLLKGTGYYLDEHFAVSIQQERVQLLPFLQAAWKRGEKCR